MAKILDIRPEEEKDFFTIEKCKKRVEDIIEADEINMEFDEKNKACLFNFGMIFGYMHYTDAGGKKRINLQNKIAKTAGKSFSNVLWDMVENGAENLNPYAIDEKKAFIISPVRNADDEIARYIRNYKERLLRKNIYEKVHFPLDDTNQKDETGTRICRDNLKAESTSGTIEVFYRRDSFGSIFDLGMDFMLKYHFDGIFCPEKPRNIKIINRQYLDDCYNYEKFLVNLTSESSRVKGADF
jgi:hypothetical protein